MTVPRRHLALWLTMCLALASTAAVPTTQATSAPLADGGRSGYIGDLACAGCHASESATYQHTSHRLASQLAGKNTVLGDFLSSGNSLSISDPSRSPDLPGLSFLMEQKGSLFIETAITGWEGELHHRSESLDIVTGSGVRGQTYLYWQGDRLFELPVSYWTDGRRWVNSPGYIDGTADFSRPVNPGCLECHATYIRATSTDPATNTYIKDSLVTGIGCETCHGPGAGHAAKYTHAQPPGSPHGDTAILNPTHFSRDLQVDACAVCHSGIQRRALLPAYSYVPGRPLKEFFEALPASAAEHPDVHGNQVGLLQRSKCFLQSPTMSCSTCHNVHEPEKAAASYSAKCLTCHQWQACGLAKTIGPSLRKNCIDCHMPVEETKVIASETAGVAVRARMRNHWIKVYPAVKAAL